MSTLANAHLEFNFDAETAQWSLRPRGQATPALIGVRGGLTWRDAAGHRHQWDGVAPARDMLAAPSVSRHGDLTTLTATLAPVGGWRLHYEFALPAQSPGLLWRLRLENVEARPLTLQQIELASVGARLGVALHPMASRLTLHPAPGPLSFFSNGYQSWSFTGALQPWMRLPVSRLRPFEHPKALNLLTPLVTGLGHFTSDMFAVLGDRAHDVGLVIGFLAQREQFGHVESLVIDSRAPYLRLAAAGDEVLVAPGETRLTDWAYAEFIRPSAEDPLGGYLTAAARENAARVPEQTPVGWCSWYHYYDKVTERDVTANAAALAGQRAVLPLQVVQLDDGFQAQVGDWFTTKPAFPSGLARLAADIRTHGLTPGLWLAPYLVRSDAQLTRQQPGWFLRAASGARVNAGFNWFRWCYALDPTHPGVREHTQRLIETAVREWGFPYLKLDFLYAAALPGQRYDPTLTRAQAMRLALADIRAAAGEAAFLLGCGCPLGPAIGLLDGMRIGTDVAPNWHPELFGPVVSRWLTTELGFTSTRNAVRNIITRAPFHRRWWLNDPDCLLVRDEATKLTEAEVRCLATVIGLSGGMFLVSDDLTRLKPERARYIAALLPVLPAGAQAVDWLDHATPEIVSRALTGPAGPWRVLGLFNWDDSPQSRTFDLARLGLPAGAYYVADFWEETVQRLAPGQPLNFPRMAPHGAHLLAIRPAAAGPAFIASTLHFSQGGEVTGWEASARELRFRLTLGRRAAGSVQLALPAPPQAASAAGQPVAWAMTGAGRYTFPLQVDGELEVQIAW